MTRDNTLVEYRISPYVTAVSLDDKSLLIGHPFFFESAVLEGNLRSAFETLREGSGSVTTASLSQRLTITEQDAEQALQYFKTRRFVLGNDEDDEDERIRKFVARRAQGRGPASFHRKSFSDQTAMNLDALSLQLPVERARDLRFAIVGGCCVQYAADALEQLAPGLGINAAVEVHWPGKFETSVLEGTDVVVFQPFTTWVLAPLWDAGVFVTAEERASRLQTMQNHLLASVTKVANGTQGRLLLVQGVSTPIFSPFGITEFRHACDFSHIVHELNQTVLEAIRSNPNAMFIDEERILSGTGKCRLVDDMVATFSHHGPLDMEIGTPPPGPSRFETFGITAHNQTGRLLAQAYLDAYITWSGMARIKCIIVDNDNTLWPGIAGEEGFNIVSKDAGPALALGVYGSIHQALKIMKQRGVLLALCSRNNESDIDAAWAVLEQVSKHYGATHLLSRDDFAVRRVNWDNKSKNIGEILETLGVSPDAALFIDDSAIEREEVRAAFPRMRQLGDNMQLVRTKLLSDPCLQSNEQTAEAANRTSLVQAQIRRDEQRKQVVDEDEFLRSLQIRLTITRVRDVEHAARITELLQRTNQFNTNLTRLTQQEVIDLLEDPQTAIYVLHAQDKFASYGLVAVCILTDAHVKAFALSCRVIPLAPAPAFLASVLSHYGQAPIHGTIVEGPRNLPCRQLYRETGFEQTGPGQYLLSDLAQLCKVDPDIYAIEIEDDALTASVA